MKGKGTHSTCLQTIASGKPSQFRSKVTSAMSVVDILATLLFQDCPDQSTIFHTYHRLNMRAAR